MTTYSDDEVHRTCQIGRLIEQRRKIADSLEAEVKCARLEGMSWAKIGLALGTSGQSAWERYGLTPQQKAERVTANDLRWTQLGIEMDV